MRATVGDRTVINGHRLGKPVRDCEVLEVHGPNGGSTRHDESSAFTRSQDR